MELLVIVINENKLICVVNKYIVKRRHYLSWYNKRHRNNSGGKGIGF